MSWDAILMKFPPKVKLEDLPNDFKAQSIGSFDFICNKLYENFPPEKLETYDSFINYSDETGYVEFSIENVENVESIGIRSNASESMLKALMKVCSILEVSLLDLQNSKIVENEEMLINSMREYRNWSNKVLNAYKK